MELKNIHNRKTFVKINETNPFGSGSEGGAGAQDGFANNAKLKDTYLGKLLNGLFSGIGWLWRKSKEYFVINRLIAQLVNELMRGIILFCFANNISLKDGTKSASAQATNKAGEGEEGEEGEGENKEDKYLNTLDEEFEKMTIEELKQKIESINKNLIDDNNTLSTYPTTIRLREEELQRNPKDKDKEKLVEKLKKEYVELQEDIKTQEEELAKYEKRLKELEGSKPTGKVNKYEKIAKDCPDFNPYAENLPPLATEVFDNPVSYAEFTSTNNIKRFTRIKPGLIYYNVPTASNKGRDEFFSAIINKKLEHGIEITNIEQNIATYNLGGTVGKIEVSKLLPDNFPNFGEIKKELSTFLDTYINTYDSMPDENKDKMKRIYMNYSIINAISEYRQRISPVLESLNEDNLVRNVGQTLAHSSGSVKVKPDEPKAGQVGLGKALAMKVGASATVGNILTKRDREKYKDKEEEFDLDVHDVNLAEIEKTVEKMDSESPETEDVKAKVSSYVNTYNLKTIQISAEQLIGGSKTAEGTDNALRLRWNKELSNTYAAFTNIMKIDPNLNIMINDFGKDLDQGKVKKAADKGVAANKAADDIGKIENSGLPLDEGTVNFSDMKDGLWCYYSVIYNLKGYNTSIAPVSNAFSDGVGLFQVTSSFTLPIDATSKKVTKDDDFFRKFSVQSNDANLTASNINVFFLIKKDKKFPSKKESNGIKNNVLVINEIISNGTSKLFLKKVNGSNVTIDAQLISKFDSSLYIHNTTTLFCAKFNKNNFTPWKDAFNLSDKNNFVFGHAPSFLTTDMMNLLKQLANFIK
jgi:hypothetical protein